MTTERKIRVWLELGTLYPMIAVVRIKNGER
jgi:hypothetical protein